MVREDERAATHRKEDVWGSATDEQKPENRQSHSIGLKLKQLITMPSPNWGREKEGERREWRSTPYAVANKQHNIASDAAPPF